MLWDLEIEQYESVEFIRELPVKPTKKTSSTAEVQEHQAPPRSASFPASLNDQDSTRSEPQLQDEASHKSAAGQSTPTGRKRGKTDTAVQEQQEGGAEVSDGATEVDGDAINPVEWIMVTRSDPGGSVPRWMVERGTPKSIAVDAAKFLSWASQPDQSSDAVSGDSEEVVQGVENRRRESFSSLQMNGRLAGIEGTDMEDQQQDAVETSKGAKQLDDDSSDIEEPQGGLFASVASVASMIHSGLESYAPRAVLDYIPGHSPQPSEGKFRNITAPVMADEASAQRDDGEDTASQTSTDTFTSAESSLHVPVPGAFEIPPTPRQGPSRSVSSSSLGASSISLNHNTEELYQGSNQRSKPTSHEKELAKLASRKKEVDAKLTTVRSEIESLGHRPAKDDTESTSTSSGQSKQKNASTPQTAAAVQDQKRIARLSRSESKLVSQLRKIEAQQLKVANKLESRQRKEAQRREKTRSRSEVDLLRKEVEDLKTQVRELRDEREKWLDLVGRLQRENTKLVAESNAKSLRGLSKEGYGTD